MPWMVNRAEIQKETAGEGILLLDGRGCRLDSGENFCPSFGIELMTIESEKEAFSKGLHVRVRILL
jgi:hypothetical protein